MDKLNIREQIQEDIITCCEPYDHVTDGLVTKLCQIVCDRLPKSAVLIYTDEIDWNLLREQKEYLVDTNYFLESEYTDGIINLIDFIQDEASTVLGEEVIFGREQSPESSWQPIETAPKDGTPILVFKPAGEYGELLELVAWETLTHCLDDPESGWLCPYSEQDERGGGVFVDNPTHWMPLPTPPENI